MKRSPEIGRRAWAALAGALGLWIFFAITKHAPAIRPYAPFDEDPYDVVGSFTFQIAVAVAALNLVRLRLGARNGASGTYIARGVLLVAAAIAVTMVSDAVAVARSGIRPRSVAEVAVWAAIALLTAFAILLARGLKAGGKGPVRPAPADEFGMLFGRAPLRGIDPQRHPVRFAALLAGASALAVTTAKIVGEGPAPTFRQTIAVIVLFLAVEAAVVFAGFLSIGRWLGLTGSLRRGAGKTFG